MTPSRADLLAAYDAELRIAPESRLPAGASVTRDGPLQRSMGYDGGGFVLYRDLDGIDGRALDELIAAQIEAFAARGEPFEWKLHGHDLPRDLPARLRRAGLRPGDTETVLIAPVEAVSGEPAPPRGVSLREVRARCDLDRIAELECALWGDDRSWLAAGLEAELIADPGALAIVVAETPDALVSAGWVRFAAGTRFATLWGGGTLPAWRRRGVYRALLAERATLARARGFGYLQVDASDDSRAILERLGFVAVTTTTPFTWAPPTPR